MKKEIFRSSQFIRKGKDSPKKESFIVFQENRKQKFEEHRRSSLQWYFSILYLYNFSC